MTTGVSRVALASIGRPQPATVDQTHSLGAAAKLRVDEIANGSLEARLEHDGWKCQHAQPGSVLDRQSTYEQVAIPGDVSEATVGAAASLRLGGVVQRESSPRVASPQLEAVPRVVVETLPEGNDTRTAPQVEAKARNSVDQLYLDEVVSASVVHVE